MKRVKDDVKMVSEQNPIAHTTFEVITTYTGLHAVWNHLITHKLHNEKHYVLTRIISRVLRFFTGIEIHPGAKIGKCLFIDHGIGIVIGETCTTEDNVTIYQGVTLGDTGKQKGKRRPDIGDDVLIAAGSKVLGNIRIDSNVNIGANSVVLQSVPSYTIVVGIPGHIAKQRGGQIEKISDHRSLSSPLFGRIKQLERQLEKAKNGEIKGDYII